MKKRSIGKEVSAYLNRSPSPVIFRTKQNRQKSHKLTSSACISEVNFSVVHEPLTLEECIQNLNNFIREETPLSKGCAEQVKYFLERKHHRNYDECCGIRQKTETNLGPKNKQNIYLHLTQATETVTTSTKTAENTPKSTKLKKRPVLHLRREASPEDTLINDIRDKYKDQVAKLKLQLTSLEEKLNKYERELNEKQILVSELENKIKDLALSLSIFEEERGAAKKKKDDKMCIIEGQLKKKETELESLDSKVKMLQILLEERQTQILYFWRAQHKKALL